MALRDITRAITAQVERVSGHPVLVTEDRSLRTLAAMRVGITYRLGQDGVEESE